MSASEKAPEPYTLDSEPVPQNVLKALLRLLNASKEPAQYLVTLSDFASRV